MLMIAMKRIILLLLFVARLVRAYDANANQQSDIWEIAYGVSGVAPTADAGGDDFMNAIESLAGTNPLNGADFPQTGLMPGLPALISGAINEVGHPASGALVQDIVAPQHRVVAFAVQRFAINLAWSLGPATAGLLEAHS